MEERSEFGDPACALDGPGMALTVGSRSLRARGRTSCTLVVRLQPGLQGADQLPRHTTHRPASSLSPRLRPTCTAGGVHWALGDAGAVLEKGRVLRAEMQTTAERRGRMHTDLARAAYVCVGGKPEQTAQELLAAVRVCPD